MPARSAFEYAVVRIVPRVERGECINVGVVLLCRTKRFLDAVVQLDGARLAVFAPELDAGALAAQLDAIPLICRGGDGAGPIGALPLYERFRWITAPRSTALQCSAVHGGLCEDPRRELERIFDQMVLPVGGVRGPSAPEEQ